MSNLHVAIFFISTWKFEKIHVGMPLTGNDV